MPDEQRPSFLLLESVVQEKLLHRDIELGTTQSKSTIPKLDRRIFTCCTKSEPVAYSVSIPTANPNIAHLHNQIIIHPITTIVWITQDDNKQICLISDLCELYKASFSIDISQENQM